VTIPSRSARVLPLALLLLAASPCLGVTIVVNSLADGHDAQINDYICQTSTPGQCTLRAAVEHVSALDYPSPVIIMVPAGTITLTLGELAAAKTFTIEGAGRTKTIISGGLASRLLKYDSGVMSLPTTLTLTHLTLRDGTVAGAGGAVLSVAPADLVVKDCLFTHNFATYGGAIQATGSFTIQDSVITDCHASQSGGAVQIAPSFTMETELANISRCALHANVALGSGGGLHVVGGYGSVIVYNSTLSGNNAGTTGGAIRAEGRLILENVTLTNNGADAVGGGGGLSSGAQADDVHVYNSILWGNYANGGNNLVVDSDCAGALTSTLPNIVGAKPQSCSITGGYTQDYPFLGALKDNGGYGPTHALLEGSPAINAVTCSGGADQRGVKRPSGAACDLGAYERAPCGDVNGDGLVSVLDVFFLINHLFAGGPVPPGLANVNQDDARDVLDVFFIVNRLFAGGPAPVCPGT
jgi:predicted outer membrane repeat protein